MASSREQGVEGSTVEMDPLGDAAPGQDSRVTAGAPATAKRHNAFVRLYRGETAFDFMGRRRWWYGLSGTIIVAGLVSLGVHGLNLGIDFKGGTSWEVRAPHATVSQVQSQVEKDGITVPIVQKLGGTFISVQADLYKLNHTAQASARSKVSDTLARIGHVPVSQVSMSDVGPTWGGSVTNKAIEAMIVFFILVSIVITVVFEWRMALAAILKVVLHDLLITVGIFSLTNFQVTSAGVIAVLTIMGYSLYDTVVVFDKINENWKRFAGKRFTYVEVVNLSLNQVLARSVNTSMVAVLPVLSVLVIGAQILGASTLQEFGFPLVIGLIAGAYSSIFIAAPNPRKMRDRDAQILNSRRKNQSVLTPRAAAGMLSGLAAQAAPPPAGKGRGGPAPRRRSGVITPGSAREGSSGSESDEAVDENGEMATSGARSRSAPAYGSGSVPARPRKKKRRR